MVPTPMPAPPMPMQAMPAPMYFPSGRIEVKSISRAPLDRNGGRLSMARMKRVVEIDAGEDGEHVSLQEGDQQLKRGQCHDHDHRKRRPEPAEHPGTRQHDDETAEYLQRDV